MPQIDSYTNEKSINSGKLLFDTLKQASFLKGGKLNVSQIAESSFTELLDLANELARISIVSDGTYGSSTFEHVSSLALGGGRQECISIDCRSERLNELARFATFYSDRVFFPNFLADYAPSFGHAPSEDSDEFRMQIAEDLKLILQVKPLIEDGILVPLTPKRNICHLCLAKSLFGEGAGKRLKIAERKLSERYFDHVSVEFLKRNDEYHLRSFAPREYLDHGSSVKRLEKIPKPISKMPELIKKILRGETVTLSKELRKKIGIHTEFASEDVASLAYQLSVAQIINTSFLTHRNLHVDILNHLSDNNDVQSFNNISQKHLESALPFLGDVPLKNLIKLRKREFDSFIEFRSALSKAMLDAKAESSNLDDKKAKQLYSDVIAPELAKLDRKVKSAKKDLIKIPCSSAIAVVGVLAFGIYTGIIPSDLIAAAKVLGLTKVLQDTIARVSLLSDTQKVIKNDKFFFLWKVRKLAMRGKHK